MKKKSLRTVLILLIACTVGALVWACYPHAKAFYVKPAVSYYHYDPEYEIQSEVDTSSLPPARAVPVLMYHGVVSETDEDNTDIEHFKAQMEMLKREGYETITLKQFDEFLQGSFVLPPKPIIITFDDGRKDSYYPTDDILRKLGFTAAIFVASGKLEEKDSFYLSWDELREMRDSGRWEIEAHGTNAHKEITIGRSGTVGNFLTSKIYYPGSGRESVAAFETRVQNDYATNISDLKNKLGIYAYYYAVPMNDVGQSASTNYPESIDFNQKMLRKYFRVAFVQANGPDVEEFSRPIYNYKDADRYSITRIEVKDMEPESLKKHLEDESPQALQLSLSKSALWRLGNNLSLAYGEVSFDVDGLHLKPSQSSQSGKILIGNTCWDNYTVEATLQRLSGRSVVLMGYVKDKDNSVSFGLTDNGLFLREMVNGQERELYSPIVSEKISTGINTLKLVLKGQEASAYLNGELVFGPTTIVATGGQVAFKAWDDGGNAEMLVESIQIYPNQ